MERCVIRFEGKFLGKVWLWIIERKREKNIKVWGLLRFECFVFRWR